MSLRHTLARTGIALAAGTLIAVAGATPALALADADRDSGRGSSNSNSNSNKIGSNINRDDGDDGLFDEGPFNDDGLDPLYEGRITSPNGLALHTSPDRGSRIIRIAGYGELVGIFCKTPGEFVGGDPLWYLLTDGTWAWGAARHIATIGPSPRWC